MVFLQFEVILYEKSSVVLYPSNSSLSNPLFALVSLPQALRDIQKNGCEGDYGYSSVANKKLTLITETISAKALDKTHFYYTKNW